MKVSHQGGWRRRDGMEKGVCGWKRGGYDSDILHGVLMQERACICLADVWPLL